MKKSLLFVLILLAAIFASKPIFASQFAGGDLTYTCIGGNAYRINLVFYRDCSGVNATPTATVTFNCSSNPMFNFNAILTLVPGGGQEITHACGSYPSSCSGGANYGVQEYVYQSVVILVPCDSWKMSYTGCCRNPVTTVQSNQYNSWYLEARVDNLNAPCNSSPTFASDGIKIACLNKSTCFKQGAIDYDNDSLSFSLQSPFTTDPTTQIVYIPPFSYSSFILTNPPLTFDAGNGDICFNATTNLVTLVGVKIEQWRKINGIQKLVGTTMRDIEIKVDQCTFHTPVLSGMDFQNTHNYSANDTIFTTEICLGDSISFDINGHDSDSYDPLILGNPERFYIHWNQGIPNASLISYHNFTDSAYAHFFWLPTASDVSSAPKCFTANVHDYACPYYNSQIYTYCIKVIGKQVDIGSDTTICINHTLLLDAGPADSYLWFNGDTTQTTLVDASTLGVGNHQVGVLVSTNGCTATGSFNLTVDACAGLKIAEESFDFQINPNPGNGVFNLICSQTFESPITIEVLSLAGQVVFRSENVRFNQKTTQVDLSELDKGNYYIRIVEPRTKYSTTKMIVIQ